MTVWCCGTLIPGSDWMTAISSISIATCRVVCQVSERSCRNFTARACGCSSTTTRGTRARGGRAGGTSRCCATWSARSMPMASFSTRCRAAPRSSAACSMPSGRVSPWKGKGRCRSIACMIIICRGLSGSSTAKCRVCCETSGLNGGTCSIRSGAGTTITRPSCTRPG